MNIQKLRDMNLHAVADELEQLRAFKAEIESQEPVFYSVHRKENEPSNAVCFDDIEAANKYVNTNYNLCVSGLYAKPVPADTVPEAIKLLQRVAEKTTERDPFEAERLAIKFCEQRGLEDRGVMYRLAIDAFTVAYRMRPLPADKPAVAVPDGWKLVPIEPTMQQLYAAESPIDEVITCRQSLQHAIAGAAYRAMLEAAPSHSQQSTTVPEAGSIMKVKRVSDQSVQVTFSSCRTASVFEKFITAVSPDRCPSHESEQEDQYPPPHVIDAWKSHCSCCPHCGNHPCDGVSAGGMCDNAECNCSDDYDSEQGGES